MQPATISQGGSKQLATLDKEQGRDPLRQQSEVRRGTSHALPDAMLKLKFLAGLERQSILQSLHGQPSTDEKLQQLMASVNELATAFGDAEQLVIKSIIGKVRGGTHSGLMGKDDSKGHCHDALCQPLQYYCFKINTHLTT